MQDPVLGQRFNCQVYRSISVLHDGSMYCRSSQQRSSFRKGVLRNFAKLTGKQLCSSHFLIKLQALGRHRCFLSIFVKCLRTPYRTPLGDCFWHWVPISTYGYDQGEVYLWTFFLMAQLRSIQKRPDILNLKLCSCEDQSECFASTATVKWCWLWDKSFKAFAFCFYLLNRRTNPVVFSLIKEN